ncbi:MAG: low molecular weight phosphatase family protein [Candidatus Saccharimonadales bacterium]
MTIHFICRGNVFRSLIAEAYLRSLNLDDLRVASSGTVAQRYWIENKPTFQKTAALLQRHGIDRPPKLQPDQLTQKRLAQSDIVVCLNQIVLDEAREIVRLPADTIVWDVADIGERSPVPTTPEDIAACRELVYQEITRNVNALARQARSQRSLGKQG